MLNLIFINLLLLATQLIGGSVAVKQDADTCFTTVLEQILNKLEYIQDDLYAILAEELSYIGLNGINQLFAEDTLYHLFNAATARYTKLDLDFATIPSCSSVADILHDLIDDRFKNSILRARDIIYVEVLKDFSGSFEVDYAYDIADAFFQVTTEHVTTEWNDVVNTIHFGHNDEAYYRCLVLLENGTLTWLEHNKEIFEEELSEISSVQEIESRITSLLERLPMIDIYDISMMLYFYTKCQRVGEQIYLILFIAISKSMQPLHKMSRHFAALLESSNNGGGDKNQFLGSWKGQVISLSNSIHSSFIEKFQRFVRFLRPDMHIDE